VTVPRIQRLSEFFRDTSSEDGREIARKITEEINLALYRNETTIQVSKDYRGTSLERALEGLKVSPLKASLMWQAYQLSRVDPSLTDMGDSSSITNILATIPSEYNVSIQALPDFIAPYAGSLLKYLAELIDSAVHELIVIAPFWSEEGVESLKHRLKSIDKLNLEMPFAGSRMLRAYSGESGHLFHLKPAT
jgi:hypothetical protein